VQKDVCDFVNQRKQTSFQYALGCVPIIKMPYTLNCKHYFSIMGFAMHACINSKKHRIEILNISQQNILDWDLQSLLSMNKFCYYKPLCYQLFGETENNKQWGDFNIIIYYLLFIFKYIYKLIKIDKQPEPGYFILYTSSKILSFVLLLFLIYLILASLFYFIK
jgi:3',5'-cyclic AMP phosphodiesterase CpdA